MDYALLGDFMGQYGLIVSLLIICIGLLFFIFVYGLWLNCLIHVFKADETLVKDRTLWIVILVGSLFLTTFATLIASVVYYSLFINKKTSS